VQFLSFFIKRSLLHRDTNFAQPVDSPFCLRIHVQRTVKENAAFWENPETNWPEFSKNSAMFWQFLQKIATKGLKQQKIRQILTKKLRIENGAKECIV